MKGAHLKRTSSRLKAPTSFVIEETFTFVFQLFTGVVPFLICSLALLFNHPSLPSSKTANIRCNMSKTHTATRVRNFSSLQPVLPLVHLVKFPSRRYLSTFFFFFSIFPSLVNFSQTLFFFHRNFFESFFHFLFVSKFLGTSSRIIFYINISSGKSEIFRIETIFLNKF